MRRPATRSGIAAQASSNASMVSSPVYFSRAWSEGSIVIGSRSAMTNFASGHRLSAGTSSSGA